MGADDEGEEDGGIGARTSHKSIPSWGEAIGVMVELNMQARKNSPQRPSSPRGDRGRGRGGRGGRGGAAVAGGGRRERVTNRRRHERHKFAAGHSPGIVMPAQTLRRQRRRHRRAARVSGQR